MNPDIIKGRVIEAGVGIAGGRRDLPLLIIETSKESLEAPHRSYLYNECVVLRAEEYAALADELKAWREGGVTEELLRRQDGYIKVGSGCTFINSDRLSQLEAHEAALQKLQKTPTHQVISPEGIPSKTP